MQTLPTSLRFFLQVLRDLIDGVRLQVGSGGLRPAYASKAVARRFAAGVRLVEAYLRRVLIVLALALEPSLIDTPKPMRRPHGRRAFSRHPRFAVLDRDYGPRADEALEALRADHPWQRKPAHSWSAPVAMGKLYRRLDQLAAIAADPVARAKRLALHLARSRPGVILAPDRGLRPPRSWRPEVALSFSVLAHDIVTRSRTRPPPLAPPRRIGPTLTVLGA